MMMHRSSGFIFGCSWALATVAGCGTGTGEPGPVARGIPGIGIGTGGAAGAPNGVVATATSDFFVMPVDPKDGSGLPPAINDAGPGKLITSQQCMDEDATYEFAIVDNYEGGKASHTYSFNDSTSEVLPLVSKDWEPWATAYPPAWTARLGKNPCGPGGPTSSEVLHLAGHFTDFGGGLGTVLFNHTDTLGTAVKFNDLSQKVGADGVVPQVAAPARPITFYPGDVAYVPGMASADLTDASSVPPHPWEGISFWARRGPFAGPGFRPGILDRTTSDDFNKQLPASMAACRSVYTTCSCPNQKPCTAWDPNDPQDPQPTADELMSNIEPLTPDVSGYTVTKGSYCWDPKVDKYPPWDPSLRCDDFACDYHANTPIPSMTYNPVNATEANLWQADAGKGPGVGTMTCSPNYYVFKDSTTPSARFCYKPGVDLDPPERMERCNDGFLAGTLLTTDWVHYFIKFSDLRQGMIDKRSSGIDLGMVEALLFAFPGGDMDLWLDDVGFYRRKSK
jgi:hypothetical protein